MLFLYLYSSEDGNNDFCAFSLSNQTITKLKQIGFKIEIKTNLKEVDFLDVTFDLRKETYRPYKKENDNCSTSTHLQIIPGPSLSKFQHPSATDYLIIPQMKKFSTKPKQNMKTRSKLLDTQQILNLTPTGQKSEIEKGT